MTTIIHTAVMPNFSQLDSHSRVATAANSPCRNITPCDRGMCDFQSPDEQVQNE